MSVFGRGATAGHLLSAAFGSALLPVAGWGGWVLGGRRAALLAAALAATCPFVTIYSDELRMYTLMVLLLSVVATVAIVRAVQTNRTAWWVGAGATIAALMYTHNWGVYFACGAVAGIGVGLLMRPSSRTVKGAGIAGLTAIVLFAPWLPTLWYQAHHTAAPWLLAPTVHGAVRDIRDVLLGSSSLRHDVIALAILVAAAGAVLGTRTGVLRSRAGRRAELAAPAIIASILIVALAAAFIVSRHSPSWIWRYLAPTVGPFLLLVALLAARTRVLGAVAVLVVVVGWATASTTVVGAATVPVTVAKLDKSNAPELNGVAHPAAGAQCVARTVEPRPGDQLLPAARAVRLSRGVRSRSHRLQLE